VRHIQPDRCQDADRLDREAPQREPEHPRRRGVHPLQVIDGDKDRAALGEQPEHGQERHRHGALVGRSAGWLPPQCGECERSLLRPGQLRQRLVDHGVQQIAQGGVGQPGLRRARPARQHDVFTPGCGADALQPDRGLADAGVAFDQQSCRAGRRGSQEPSDGGELLLATQRVPGRLSDRHRRKHTLPPVPRNTRKSLLRRATSASRGGFLWRAESAG
jgi:hypothetical protein